MSQTDFCYTICTTCMKQFYWSPKIYFCCRKIVFLSQTAGCWSKINVSYINNIIIDRHLIDDRTWKHNYHLWYCQKEVRASQLSHPINSPDPPLRVITLKIGFLHVNFFWKQYGCVKSCLGESGLIWKNYRETYDVILVSFLEPILKRRNVTIA